MNPLHQWAKPMETTGEVGSKYMAVAPLNNHRGKVIHGGK
jgi:hypothetical protein